MLTLLHLLVDVVLLTVGLLVLGRLRLQQLLSQRLALRLRLRLRLSQLGLVAIHVQLVGIVLLAVIGGHL